MKKQDTISTKKILQIVLTVALLGFVVCVGIIVAYVTRLNKGNEHYEDLQQEYATVEETTTEAEEEYVCPIDFEAMQTRENPDVYAWIKIPDTKVDYPILQHPEDDTYYLTHTIDGTYGFPGAIYTEMTYNQKTFLDPVTVVYGHNMKDGSMFRELYKFMDQDFFDSHKDFIIYMSDRKIDYEVFGAFIMDDQRILVWNDFSDKEMSQALLEDIKKKEQTDTNHVRTDLDVSIDDRYVVLETCIDDEPFQRFVVIGREVQ